MECVAILRELGKHLERKERSRSKEDLVKALLGRVENLKQIMGYLHEMPIIVNEAKLNTSISIQEQINTRENPFTGNLAIATIAFLLIELVSQLMHLIDAQKVLEGLSKFREPKANLDKSFTSKKYNPCLDSLTIHSAE